MLFGLTFVLKLFEKFPRRWWEGVNLIQTNTSNFQNFTKLHCTATHVSHILNPTQVFNILRRSRVIKVSIGFSVKSIMSLDWEFSSNFHLLSHLTLSSMKSKAENLPRCQADAPPFAVDEDDKHLTHQNTFWRNLWPNFLTF